MGTRRRPEPGTTLFRGQSGFDDAVLSTSFSAEDPGRRPEAIVQANIVGDVRDAVRLAGMKDWRVACCSGGHAWSQNHIRDGGLLLDLSRLDNISIDPQAMTAVVGCGCRSGDLDAALAAHGLFFPVAHAYTVGLGGFLLQGGFGWNSRVDGTGCENLIGIDVVLADGSQVHANERENADIFWAARGSGPGFFGIVVAFHLRLRLRPAFTGLKMQVFRLHHLEEVLAWAHAIGPTVSPKVELQLVVNRKAFGIFAPGIEVVTPVLADSKKEAKELLSFIDRGSLRAKASLTLPLLPLSLGRIMKLAEKVIFLPNTRWHVDNVWLGEPIEPLLPLLRDIANRQPAAPSHILWMNWNPASRNRPDMAFSLEGSTYLAFYGGLRGKSARPDDRDWATRSARALQPYAIGSQLADENLARRPAVFMAPAHRTRLEALRATHDPHHRFFSYGDTQ